MIVAPGLGMGGHPGRWVQIAQLDDAQADQLAAELQRAGRAAGLHDHHVVAWSIHLLSRCAGWHAGLLDDLHANQSNAEARAALEKIAVAAQALGAMLAQMSARARAYYTEAVVRQAQVPRELAGQWKPERFEELWSIAIQAAGLVPAAVGRPATMLGSIALVDDVALVVERHQIAVSQGGAFLRICQVVFAAAGVPAAPRESIRRWQRQREKPAPIG